MYFIDNDCDQLIMLEDSDGDDNSSALSTVFSLDGCIKNNKKRFREMDPFDEPYYNPFSRLKEHRFLVNNTNILRNNTKVGYDVDSIMQYTIIGESKIQHLLCQKNSYLTIQKEEINYNLIKFYNKNNLPLLLQKPIIHNLLKNHITSFNSMEELCTILIFKKWINHQTILRCSYSFKNMNSYNINCNEIEKNDKFSINNKNNFIMMIKSNKECFIKINEGTPNTLNKIKNYLN